jgi:polyisoprenoid-binding protein YceI
MSIKNSLMPLTLTCFLMFFSLGVTATPVSWQIVPNESELTFTGTQNGAPVSGNFKQFSGTIMFDPNDLKNSSINIVVDINSVITSYAELKDTLLTSDWFDAKSFPKAEFKSAEIDKVNDKEFAAKGTLTIRDKSQPVVLTFTESESGSKATASGSTSFKRTIFGVGQGEWAGTGQVKDDVTINFKVVATKK